MGPLMKEKNDCISRYQDFILRNRRSMNESMSRILFFCAFAGPAIALDHLLGYCDVSYQACIGITLSLILLSFGQKILNHYCPLSLFTVFWGLLGFMGVLTFMCLAHVGVYITYALVPMVSLFYCEKFIYLISVALNYLMILISNVLVSDFRFIVRTDVNGPLDWFLSVMSGYTIESIAIGVAGYYLCSRISNNFKEIYNSNLELDEKERDGVHKSNVAHALTSLYQCVYVFDLKRRTYEVVQSDRFIADLLRGDGLAATIERVVFSLVEKEDTDKVMKFLDLATLPERLEKDGMIYTECMGTLHGKCQISFVLVDKDEQGKAASVMFTLRKIS